MYDHFDRTEEEILSAISEKESYFASKKAQLLRNSEPWEKEAIKEEISHIESLTWVEDFHKDMLRLKVEEGCFCEYAQEYLSTLLRTQQSILQDKRSLRKSQKQGE